MRSFLLLALPLLASAALAPHGAFAPTLKRASASSLADTSSNLALRCAPSTHHWGA